MVVKCYECDMNIPGVVSFLYVRNHPYLNLEFYKFDDQKSRFWKEELILKLEF